MGWGGGWGGVGLGGGGGQTAWLDREAWLWVGAGREVEGKCGDR